MKSFLLKIKVINFFLGLFWYLILKKKFHNSKIKKINKIKYDDIFIVTSCTNPSDFNSYKNHNILHTSNIRLKELLETFNSIKSFYPNAYIINIENSKISRKDSVIIKKKVNKHLNYFDDDFIKLSRKHRNKGVPWLCKLIKFLNENNNNLNYKRLHFLAGRYSLLKSIQKKTYTGVYFKFYQKYHNVSTRYFYYNFVPVNDILNSLKKTLLISLKNYSAEDFIFNFQSAKVFFLKKIGVKGKVNGLQQIFE
jgi:hypothetical protein